MPPPSRLSALTIALILALSAILPVAATHHSESHEFGDDAFWATWAHTDEPVAAGQVDRTWMWGPEPYSPRMSEPYVEGPGGMRTVQYFDKSRMEITDPGTNRNSLWFVTNGLLVVEMVEGHFQLGHNQFDPSPDPADIPIAGDPNSGSPTYADINAFGLRDAFALHEGTAVTEMLTGDGTVVNHKYLGDYGVRAAQHVTETDHTVASVFWSFMTSVGVVFEANADTRSGSFAIDALFPNPFYATGFPITEAYWTTATLQGQPTDILWQCFERRCLTYTPSNESGWQVEAGNVGQHYYNWRYPFGVPTEEAVIYLVDELNTRGVAETFGCGDSLYPLTIPIPVVDTTEARIAATLQPLLALGETTGALAQWTNVLGTDLYVQSVHLEGGSATIHLVGQFVLGGVCDDPRIEAQLQATVLQFEGVDEVTFLLNGEPMFPITGQ